MGIQELCLRPCFSFFPTLAHRLCLGIFYILCLVSCQQNSGTDDEALGEEDLRGFFIERVSPAVVTSGDELAVYGSEFSDTLKLTIGGREVQDYQLLSAKELRVKVPEFDSSQKIVLQLRTAKKQARFHFLYLGAGQVYRGAASASEICEGETFFDKDDNPKLGTKSCPGTAESGSTETSSNGTYAACSGPNQLGCLANSTFKTMDLSSASAMTDLTAANFESSLATGNTFEFWDSTGVRHQVAGSSFLVAANIKAGVHLLGVTGAYPSANYPLPSASAVADLDGPTFHAKIKASAAFEYWTSDGTYQTGLGDADIDAANIKSGVAVFGTTGTLDPADLLCTHTTQGSCVADSACLWNNGACSIDPWNIRVGKSIAGTLGQLKVNCRNRANNLIFNTDAIPPGNSGSTSGTTINWWDTIDDYNSNGAFPPSLVATWSSDTDCDRTVWRDLTADGACDSASDDCLIKDQISGLIWSESYPATGAAAGTTMLDWSLAVNRCDALIFGGNSDWRLPTHKELLDAYVHGIRDLGYKGSGSVRAAGSLDNNDAFIASIDISFFWSASTISDLTTNAWTLHLVNGNSNSDSKSTSPGFQMLCVRP